MDTVISSLTTFFALIIGTAWAGRALLLVLNLRPFQAAGFENYLLATFAGTACWGLLTAWSSYLGLAAAGAGLVVLSISALLTLGVLIQGKVSLWLATPSFRDIRWELLVLSLAMLYCMMDVLVWGSFLATNDSFTYIQSSEWLQTHGFYEPNHYNSHQPIDMEIRCFQEGGVRMGASFLLALCQALSLSARAMHLYPGVLAFGVLLNLAAVYLLIRWCLLLPRFYALLAMMMAGLLTSPIHFSAGTGFLHQGYGTAFLAVSVAILARALPVWNHNVAMALLVAILHAGTVLYYSELLPFLLGADCIFSLLVLRNGYIQGRVVPALGFVGGILILVLLVTNHEFYRVLLAVRLLTQAVVGWQIPFDPLRYLAFVMGIVDYSVLTSSRAYTFITILCGCLGLFCAGWAVLGLARTLYRQRSLLLLGACLPLFGLLTYFAFFVQDPVLHVTGHRWNLFKLCKYGYLLILALQVLGLWFFVRTSPQRQRILLASVLAVCVIHFPFHVRVSKQRAKAFARFLNCKQPMQELARLRTLVQDNRPDQIIIGSDVPFREAMLLYAIHPQEPLNIHDGSWRCYCAKMSLLPATSLQGKVLLIDGFDQVDGNTISTHWLDLKQPSILRVPQVEPSLFSTDRDSIPVNDRPITVDVYAPRAGIYSLRFSLDFPSDEFGSQFTLTITDANGRKTFPLSTSSEQSLELPISLFAGISQITFQGETPERSPSQVSTVLLRLVRPMLVAPKQRSLTLLDSSQ